MTDAQKLGKTSKTDGRSRNRPNDGRGRPAGIPNKITRDLREIIRNFAEQNAEIAMQLWRDTAKNDPARAFDQYFGALEYVTPKLNRTELSGPDGGPVCVVALPNIAENSEKWEQIAKESQHGRS